MATTKTSPAAISSLLNQHAEFGLVNRPSRAENGSVRLEPTTEKSRFEIIRVLTHHGYDVSSRPVSKSGSPLEISVLGKFSPARPLTCLYCRRLDARRRTLTDSGKG